jgi:hypothetical protein
MTRIYAAAALLAASYLALPTLAEAQVTKKGSAYQFRTKFKKGQVIKYQFDTTIAGPQAMTIEMPMKMSVLNVVKDIADIEATVGPISMNGKAMGQPGTGVQTQTFKMNNMGKVVGNNAKAVGLGASLPEKPIPVGGTYTATLPLGPAAGGGNAKATYKFKGIKNVDGRPVAELAVTVASAGTQKLGGSGTIFLLVSDGSLHKANLDMQMTPPTGASKGSSPQQPVKFNIVMKRL